MMLLSIVFFSRIIVYSPYDAPKEILALRDANQKLLLYIIIIYDVITLLHSPIRSKSQESVVHDFVIIPLVYGRSTIQHNIITPIARA
jgi:hypothetical protein